MSKSDRLSRRKFMRRELRTGLERDIVHVLGGDGAAVQTLFVLFVFCQIRADFLEIAAIHTWENDSTNAGSSKI